MTLYILICIIRPNIYEIGRTVGRTLMFGRTLVRSAGCVWSLLDTNLLVKIWLLNFKFSFLYSILEDHIQNARETLGVEQVCKKDDPNDDEVTLSTSRRFSHLDALADKLNSEGDKTGFFQMVNRSSRLNASSYSLSSLYR